MMIETMMEPYHITCQQLFLFPNLQVFFRLPRCSRDSVSGQLALPVLRVSHSDHHVWWSSGEGHPQQHGSHRIVGVRLRLRAGLRLLFWTTANHLGVDRCHNTHLIKLYCNLSNYLSCFNKRLCCCEKGLCLCLRQFWFSSAKVTT